MKNITLILFVLFISFTSFAQITGSATVTVCKTTTLSCSGCSGGTWSSSNTGVATIGSTGIVTGVAVGTSTIDYTCSGTTYTFSLTVNPVASITGPSNVCPGHTITLSDATSGGTWTSHPTGIVTISSSGVVSPTYGGYNTIITYSLGSGCQATYPITTNPISPISVTGSGAICQGVTSTIYSDPVSGGTWTSNTIGVATIDLTNGYITGVSVGSSTITYTTSAGCVATTVATVVPFAAITGSYNSVCQGHTITLSDAASGGTWSSSAPTIATVSSSGVVTGVAGGLSATISYTHGSCTATYQVTVNSISPISVDGTVIICQGQTVSPYSDATTGGGTWSSSSSGIASINTTSGVVTGGTPGTATITFATSAGCIATTVATVNPLQPVTGTYNSVCVGQTITLADAVSGGTWSSSAVTEGTVNPLGIVTGIAVGATPPTIITITYTTGQGCKATYPVTINALSPISIDESAILCQGQTTIRFTDATSGGTWYSTNTGVATINSSTGAITGIGSGTTTISYVTSAGCTATTGATVYPLAPITGPTHVCRWGTITLSDIVPGGTWSDQITSISLYSSTYVASVNPTTGVVTGIAAGLTGTITYTTPGGCIASFDVTVDSIPVLSPITGPSSVCVGSVITLSNTTPGGVWSSSATGVAIVNTISGIVTGLSAGTTIITYAVTNTCGTGYVTKTITVNPLPVVDTITGTDSVCVGSTTTLYDSPGGGVWSSSNNSIATVGSGTGIVTGVSPGVVTITYTVTNSCGIAFATTTVTVNSLPVVDTITGTDSVCVGSTTTLYDSPGGGVWSSGNNSIATVGSGTGIVTGVSPGVVTITYTVTNSCGIAFATTTVTVNSLPVVDTITGTDSVCVGSTTTLYDSPGGGVWSSSNTGIATVGSGTGIVTGISPGVVTITYTVTNSCGAAYATTTVTVDPLPGADSITGADSVCVGSTVTLYDTPGGGVWSSSNNSIATVGSGTGIVTGISAGVVTITYTVTNSCGTAYATTTVTVNPSPDPITGAGAICLSSTETLYDDIPGGTWSSSPTTIAIVNPVSGVVTGISAGTATITYTLGHGCYATIIVTVNDVPMPNVSCTDDRGVFKFINYDGLSGVTVNYTADIAQIGITTVNVTPVSPLSLYSSTLFSPTFTPVFISFLVSTSDSLSWTILRTYQLTVSYEGCTWVELCSTEARYANTNSNGTMQSSAEINFFSIIPNPNSGTFTLQGTVPDIATSKDAKIEAIDMLGKVVYRDVVTIENGNINKTITLGDNIANGIYLIKVKNEEVNKVLRFTLDR